MDDGRTKWRGGWVNGRVADWMDGWVYGWNEGRRGGGEEGRKGEEGGEGGGEEEEGGGGGVRSEWMHGCLAGLSQSQDEYMDKWMSPNIRKHGLLFAASLGSHEQERLLVVLLQPGREQVQAPLDVRGLDHGKGAWGRQEVFNPQRVWNLSEKNWPWRPITPSTRERHWVGMCTIYVDLNQFISKYRGYVVSFLAKSWRLTTWRWALKTFKIRHCVE